MNDLLRSARAIALVDYITRADHPFARLDHIAADGSRDVIDLTVEPELAQDRKVPIAAEEAIRLSFAIDDSAAPRITSLRDTFPIGLVHTNLEKDVDGLCLCVWEEAWHDLRRTLTAQALVERIRDWFSRTARGDIHQEGQALEPLIAASAHSLIIPSGDPPDILHVVNIHTHKGRSTLTLSATAQANAGHPQFAIYSTRVDPVVHGALRDRPRTLSDLADAVTELGRDLVAELSEWILRDENRQAGADRWPLFLIWIPKIAVAGGEVLSWELWASSPPDTMAQLGDKLGQTFHDVGTNTLLPRVPPGPVQDLSAILLDGWRVVQRLDIATARIYAGNPTTQDASIVGIGAGAIGSQVISNTVRAGIGRWTVIDDDLVLPHNTVRQVQTDRCVGFPKADTLRIEANAILEEDSVGSIRADLLDPGEHAAAIEHVFAVADLVVDFSASPAVLGHIAGRADVRRAASFFFNPDGSDLVILAEDADRRVRLDELEAQYFLAATTEPLKDHLGAARLDRLRYANACQDLSRPLPPWQVQTLAAIAGGRLLGLVGAPERIAQMWQLDPATGAVVPCSLMTSTVHRFDFEGFRGTITSAVIAKMRMLRGHAAPNETGGVLVGSFDADRRVVHVVDALPAPPDSRQSPTHFVRGAKHLKPLLETLASRSAATLTYVGEWHSHPDGAAARPSGDDEKVFAYLTRQLDPTGNPYLMAICGAVECWLRAGWRGGDNGEAVFGHDD